jgi:hypothetical protein
MPSWQKFKWTGTEIYQLYNTVKKSFKSWWNKYYNRPIQLATRKCSYPAVCGSPTTDIHQTLQILERVTGQNATVKLGLKRAGQLSQWLRVAQVSKWIARLCNSFQTQEINNCAVRKYSRRNLIHINKQDNTIHLTEFSLYLELI